MPSTLHRRKEPCPTPGCPHLKMAVAERCKACATAHAAWVTRRRREARACRIAKEGRFERTI